MIYKCFRDINSKVSCLVDAISVDDAHNKTKCKAFQVLCRKDDIKITSKRKNTHFSIHWFGDFVFLSNQKLIAKVSIVDNKKRYSYTWRDTAVENTIQAYIAVI